MKTCKSILCLLLAVLILTACSVQPIGGGTETAGSPAQSAAAETTTEAASSPADSTAPAETAASGTTASETTVSESAAGAAGTETQNPQTAAAEIADFPASVTLSCGQAFAYDLTEGTYLAMHGRGQRLYPASITKLLTILTAMRSLQRDTLVTPGDEQTLLASDASVAYVNSSHTLTAEMLVEGMLLPSGNDAALALAAAAGRVIAGNEALSGVDAVSAFMGEMNRYAGELGLTGSHFVTPDGYYDDNHYSTVEDMAAVSVLAAKDPLIREFCGLQSADVVYASGHTNHWTNTNLMLDPASTWYNASTVGMKTGSVTGSYSLVCIFQKDGKEYVAGVFSAPDGTARYADMKNIAAWLLGA